MRIDRPARSTTSAVTAISAANAMSSTAFAPALPPEVEKKNDNTTTAAKSATVAAAMAVCPTVVAPCPASLSTGTTRPSDVAESATAISSGCCTQPTACSAPPTTRPSASEIA